MNNSAGKRFKIIAKENLLLKSYVSLSACKVQEAYTSIINVNEYNCNEFYFEVTSDEVYDPLAFESLTICRVWRNDVALCYTVFHPDILYSCAQWIDQDVPPTKFQCTCDHFTLINCGCKCGAFKAEIDYKNRLKREAEDIRLFGRIK